MHTRNYILALGLAIAFQQVAHAHAIIEFPAARPGSSSGNTVGPCGVAASGTPTVLLAGSTVTLQWEETIHHNGNFQFYLAPTPTENTGLPMGVPSPTPGVALYGVAQSFNNAANLPHQYSASVTLPNTPCAACTIQMFQVNTDGVAGTPAYPPAGTTPVYYFTCADVQLVSSQGVTPSPTPSPSPCAVGPSPAPSPSASPVPLAPTFTNVNANIIQPHCIGCHATATATNMNVSLATYANVLSQINVANPTQSTIYIVTSDGAMPEGSPPLTTIQETLLLQWIQAGAPNN